MRKLLKILPFLDLNNLRDFRESVFSSKRTFLFAGLICLIFFVQEINLYKNAQKNKSNFNYGFLVNKDLFVSIYTLKHWASYKHDLFYPDRLINVEGVPITKAKEYYQIIRHQKDSPKPLLHTFKKRNGSVQDIILKPYTPNDSDFFIRFILPWGAAIPNFIGTLIFLIYMRSGLAFYLATIGFVATLWFAHYPDWETTHVYSNFTLNFGFLFAFLLIVGTHILYEIKPGKYTQINLVLMFFACLILFIIHNGFVFIQGFEKPYAFIGFYLFLILVCLRGSYMPLRNYFTYKPRSEALAWVPTVLLLIVLAFAIVSPLQGMFFGKPIQGNYLFPLAFFVPFITLYSIFISTSPAIVAQRARLNTASVLLAGISHEVLNPLNNIFLWRSVLEKNIELLDEVEVEIENQEVVSHMENIRKQITKCSDRIYTGADRIKNIIEDIRVNTQEDLNIESHDLNQEIKKAITFLSDSSEKRRISMVFEPNDEYVIKCDASKINQVLVNVLNNAVAASQSHGKVNVKTSKDQNYLNISITDTGKGMTPDQVEKAFDPFFTTKDPGEGMGIGLYICSQIMKMHKGKIDIQSEVNVKTVVTISLPLT